VFRKETYMLIIEKRGSGVLAALAVAALVSNAPTLAEFIRHGTQDSAHTASERSAIQFADIGDQIVAYAAGAPINVASPAVQKRAVDFHDRSH
jgi:hypothetical protein